MATVDRVLPWRRHQLAAPGASAAMGELAPLLAAYRRRHPKASISDINRAYRVASEAHRSQMRTSGESYQMHFEGDGWVVVQPYEESFVTP